MAVNRWTPRGRYIPWVEAEPSEPTLLPVNPDRGRDAGYIAYGIHISDIEHIEEVKQSIKIKIEKSVSKPIDNHIPIVYNVSIKVF